MQEFEMRDSKSPLSGYLISKKKKRKRRRKLLIVERELEHCSLDCVFYDAQMLPQAVQLSTYQSTGMADDKTFKTMNMGMFMWEINPCTRD